MSAPPPTVCALCGTEDAGRACTRCQTPHHQDCWDYGGGCSIYGCAGGAAGPATPTNPTAPVEIDEASLPVVSRASRVTAWIRWVARDAHALPRTLGTSLTTAVLGGAAIAAGTGIWAALVMAPAVFLGLAFGVVSAYAGRTLHRSPVSVGVAGGAMAAASTVALGLDVPRRICEVLEAVIGDPRLPFIGLSLWGLVVNLFLATALVGVLVAGVAASEHLLGPRSLFGQRVLPASSPPGILVRLGATGLLVLGLLHGVGALVTATFGYTGPADAYLAFAPHASAALTLLAWPALERGKNAYLAKLPPARRELSG